MREFEAHSSEKAIVFSVFERVFIEEILYLVGEGRSDIRESSALRHLYGLDELRIKRTTFFSWKYWLYCSFALFFNLEAVIFQFDGNQWIETDKRAAVLS